MIVTHLPRPFNAKSRHAQSYKLWIKTIGHIATINTFYIYIYIYQKEVHSYSLDCINFSLKADTINDEWHKTDMYMKRPDDSMLAH